LALPKEDKIDRRFELTEEGRAAFASGTVQSERETQILGFLKKEPKTAAFLQRKIGKNFIAVLSPLKRKDWISQRWVATATTTPAGAASSPRMYVGEMKRGGGEGDSEPSLHQLNADQQAVWDQIGTAMGLDAFSPFLLHGVTGSGKTEVYMRVIEKALSVNKGAIVLVPEIGLTPQLAARFDRRFGKTVAQLHSGLSPSMRHQAWMRIKRGEARIAIGARSALFAPMDDIGVIIVDEEHDPSYKQEEGVRYHARDTALFYGKLLNAVVVLGSATPSMESLYNGTVGKYKTISLPKRVSNRPLPALSIVDLRERATWVRPFLTRRLIDAIEKRLLQKEQVILFVNRRGHCPTLLCGDCGHRWRCENCSVSLSFHKNVKKLLCHYCGYWIIPQANCPTCGGTRLLYLGVGTERVEEEIKTLFPSARILRMDRDTTSNSASQHKTVAAMENGDADILIGTQMVAKGHDFPQVTLVGVVSADTALNLPDFRAGERTFDLLTQVVYTLRAGNH
jgi:primosomal protein N' (replication factor Y)